jgi:hypothetical protein
MAKARSRFVAGGAVAVDQRYEPGPQRIHRRQDLGRAGAKLGALDPQLAVGESVAGAPLAASAGDDGQTDEEPKEDQSAWTVMVTVALLLAAFGSA